jgi:hypothetical protein
MPSDKKNRFCIIPSFHYSDTMNELALRKVLKFFTQEGVKTGRD